MSESRFNVRLSAMPDRVILRFPPPVEVKTGSGLLLPSAHAIGTFGVVGQHQTVRRDEITEDNKKFRPEAAELYSCGWGLSERTKMLADEIKRRADAGERFLIPMELARPLWRREMEAYGEEFADLINLRTFNIEDLAQTISVECRSCHAQMDITAAKGHECHEANSAT